MEIDEHNHTLRRLRRTSVLVALWRHDESFAQVFAAAARTRFARKAKEPGPDTTAFLDNVVVRLVSRPADLLALCSMLDDERIAREFMRFYVRHELVDRDVVFALVESPAIFKALPDDPAWMEVAVLLYGSEKLNDNEGAKLSIAEFAPLGLDVERPTVRWLVGSAFDAGMLADEDCERLLEMFPEDAYFRAKLAKTGEKQ